MKLLYEGSESKIFILKNDILLKRRIRKTYRKKQIDNFFRLKRTRAEFKILKKLFHKDLNVPEPIDFFEKTFSIKIRNIKGEVLKNHLNKKNLFLAFENIISIHNLDVIHNDLTTLNMILKDDKVYLIDFGISFISKRAEDKANDLNLFFENIKNEHKLFLKHKKELLKIYKTKVLNSKMILEKYDKLIGLGRNKSK